MELIDAIKGRKSIRRFKPEPVSMGLVREVLDAANYAPSAKRGEQWRFTVLTGGAKDAFIAFFDAELDKLVKEHGAREAGSSRNSCRIMDHAPVLVIVWNSGEHGWTTEEHSVAAAIQNMLLQATEHAIHRTQIHRVLPKAKGLQAIQKLVAVGHVAVQ